MKPINILSEPLVLMHPGLRIPLRIGIDTSGAIVLLDLSDFNVLPQSFLRLKGNENAYSMARVKLDLLMTADPTFGAFAFYLMRGSTEVCYRFRRRLLS